MGTRLQISEWLEGEPAGEIGAPTPREEPQPAPEPSVVSRFGGDPAGDAPIDFSSLRHRLTTARELVRHRAAQDRRPPLATAVPELDRLLEGGLARGEMVELVGNRSSGRFSLVLAVLSAITETGDVAALIDLGDGLQPADAERAGVELERLLWLRPRRLNEALAGAEMLVTGGFPLVVADLGVPPVPGGRGATGAWIRLARTAERHRAALLVSAPYRVSGPAAAIVLATHGEHSIRRRSPLSPALVLGLDARLRLEKARGRSPGATEELRLACAG